MHYHPQDTSSPHTQNPKFLCQFHSQGAQKALSIWYKYICLVEHDAGSVYQLSSVKTDVDE